MENCIPSIIWDTVSCFFVVSLLGFGYRLAGFIALEKLEKVENMFCETVSLSRVFVVPLLDFGKELPGGATFSMFAGNTSESDSVEGAA